VPVCFHHRAENGRYEMIGNVTVKEVRHRIDKDSAWLSPAKRQFQALGPEPEVEPLHKGMTPHSSKSFGESLGIAVIATRANLRATRHRVPACVGPFNARTIAHVLTLCEAQKQARPFHARADPNCAGPTKPVRTQLFP
jgi:hypothetical protein